MGLDMYLTRKMYVKDWDHTPKEERKNIEVFINGKKIKTNKLQWIEFEAMYWRKANAIHSWFVENIQEGRDDCGAYEVSSDKLRDLMNLCLYIMKDPSRASELLPTKNGFFFGTYEYDEFYFSEIESTYKKLRSILNTHKDDYFFYQSSW